MVETLEIFGMKWTGGVFLHCQRMHNMGLTWCSFRSLYRLNADDSNFAFKLQASRCCNRPGVVPQLVYRRCTHAHRTPWKKKVTPQSIQDLSNERTAPLHSVSWPDAGPREIIQRCVQGLFFHRSSLTDFRVSGECHERGSVQCCVSEAPPDLSLQSAKAILPP